jgi:hypothetical protein
VSRFCISIARFFKIESQDTYSWLPHNGDSTSQTEKSAFRKPDIDRRMEIDEGAIHLFKVIGTEILFG